MNGIQHILGSTWAILKDIPIAFRITIWGSLLIIIIAILLVKISPLLIKLIKKLPKAIKVFLNVVFTILLIPEGKITASIRLAGKTPPTSAYRWLGDGFSSIINFFQKIEDRLDGTNVNFKKVNKFVNYTALLLIIGVFVFAYFNPTSDNKYMAKYIKFESWLKTDYLYNQNHTDGIKVPADNYQSQLFLVPGKASITIYKTPNGKCLQSVKDSNQVFRYLNKSTNKKWYQVQYFVNGGILQGWAQKKDLKEIPLTPGLAKYLQKNVHINFQPYVNIAYNHPATIQGIQRVKTGTKNILLVQLEVPIISEK